MLDVDIRQALRELVLADHEKDADTVILDELGLRQGAVRVDIAVVNGSLHGFEIKSPADTLRRLPQQAAEYSRVLEFVTLVVADRHYPHTRSLVPAWWGLLVVKGDGDQIKFRSVRSARRNPSVDKRALAELLWHEETLALLRERNLGLGLSRRPRADAWNCLSENFSLEDIGAAVREKLKGRRQPPVDRL